MATYTQDGRALKATTPLGPDVLLLRGFAGQEAVSQLFDFEVDLLAENGTDVPFDRLLGQKIGVELSLDDDEVRHFSGICSRVAEGGVTRPSPPIG